MLQRWPPLLQWLAHSAVTWQPESLCQTFSYHQQAGHGGGGGQRSAATAAAVSLFQRPIENVAYTSAK